MMRLVNMAMVKIDKVYSGVQLRYYRLMCSSMGNNVSLSRGIRVRFPERLKIGNNVAINNDVWINAAGNVEIGNNTLIGPKVVIHSANHKFDQLDIPIRTQGHVMKEVIIEEDIWIGAAAIILPGVKIGKGSVIAAGAVVTKDVPPFSIAMGVPAQVKKSRSAR